MIKKRHFLGGLCLTKRCLNCIYILYLAVQSHYNSVLHRSCHYFLVHNPANQMHKLSRFYFKINELVLLHQVARIEVLPAHFADLHYMNHSCRHMVKKTFSFRV